MSKKTYNKNKLFVKLNKNSCVFGHLINKGLFVDDEQTIYIADRDNHRIVEWKSGATNGTVIAGGGGRGTGDYLFNEPTDVIVDKETESIIIADRGNRRVVRWPRRGGKRGETLVTDVTSTGLTLDEQGALYVADNLKHEVRRYRRGETKGKVVAGGNGQGTNLNQLSNPQNVFVDRERSVYVSDLLTCVAFGACTIKPSSFSLNGR